VRASRFFWQDLGKRGKGCGVKVTATIAVMVCVLSWQAARDVVWGQAALAR